VQHSGREEEAFEIVDQRGFMPTPWKRRGGETGGGRIRASCRTDLSKGSNEGPRNLGWKKAKNKFGRPINLTKQRSFHPLNDVLDSDGRRKNVERRKPTRCLQTARLEEGVFNECSLCIGVS